MALAGLVSVLIFALLASLVSWPWHQPAGTLAGYDLAAQSHPGDAAKTRFCLAMVKVESGASDALRALHRGDSTGLTDAIASIETNINSAQAAAAAHVSGIDNVAPLRQPLEEIRAAQRDSGKAQPKVDPLTSHLVQLSLAAKLEGARAGCPTFRA